MSKPQQGTLTILLRAIAVGVPALGLGVTIVAGWPGGISPDMGNTLSEGSAFLFGGHQSPMFSLLWSVPLWVLPVSGAIAFGYVLQSCAYWGAFALFAFGSLRRGSRVFAVLASVAGFIPSVFAFTVMIESNVQMGAAWILAIALAYAFPFKRTLWFCVPLLFAGYCARYGTTAPLPAVLFTCFSLVTGATTWKRALRSSLIATTAFVLISMSVSALLPGSPNRNRNVEIWFLGDIARVYQVTGSHCIPPAFVPKTTTAEAILADFNTALPTEIIWVNKHRFDVPDSDVALNALKQCWEDTVRRFPQEYVSAKARYALIFMMVGVGWAPATTPDYTANPSLGLSVASNGLSTSMQAYIERSRRSLWWKGWFWVLVAGIATGLMVVFRHSVRAAGLGLLVGGLAAFAPHLVTSLGALSRQFFPPFLLLICCVLIAGGGRRGWSFPGSFNYVIELPV